MRAYFDLIAGFGARGSILGFELCDDKPRMERVCCWIDDSGYNHFVVDSGESEPLAYKMTPTYLPDGTFDKHPVLARFTHEAMTSDAAIRQGVLAGLAAFGGDSQTE